MQPDIAHLLHKKENETLEYKESFDKEEIGEAIASFSTAMGGTILVGVRKDGIPIGLEINEDEIRRKLFDIRGTIQDSYPNIKIDFVAHTPTKKIIVIHVSEGAKKPYGWKGIYYRRDFSTNKRLNPTEITRLNLMSRNLTFDILKAQIYGRDANLGDLDENKIKTYIKAYNSSRRNKKMSFTNINEFLCNTSLLLNEGIKNSAILLFGKNPQDAFPNSRINFLMYDGEVEDATKLKAKRLIQGDLISQINEVLGLIKAYTENRVFMEGFRRIEVNQYPLEAIREAIINAIGHRDYSVFDSYINIRLFNNRLEITNPGKLMEGITLERIRPGGLSKRRNISICLTLDNIGFMEESGQGIRNIILALKKAGLREPLLKEDGEYFKVEFYTQSNNSEKDLGVIGTTTDLSTQLTQLQKEGLNKIQELELDTLTIKDYMSLISTNSRITAKTHLERFRELGLLRPRKEGKFLVYKKVF